MFDNTKVGLKMDYMEQLRQIMEDTTFRGFFNDYCKDWSYIKVIFMMMKTYIFIEEEFYQRNGIHLKSTETISILKQMLKNPKLNGLMVDSLTASVIITC